jgi:hypothetical protein
MEGSIISAVGAVLVVAMGWLLNEYARRRSDDYRRREQRYRRLVLGIRGMYVDSRDVAKTEQAAEEVSLAWLYCPPAVVRKANTLMESVRVGATDATKDCAEAELLLAIRTDLRGSWLRRRALRQSELEVGDFKRWGANRIGQAIANQLRAQLPGKGPASAPVTVPPQTGTAGASDDPQSQRAAETPASGDMGEG